MSADGDALFEEAPCGYVTLRPDGTVVRVNRAFAALAGRGRDDLVGRRFPELLGAGGRIYYESHLAPLLRVEGEVQGVALDLVRPDGTRVPTLLNAATGGAVPEVRVAVFDASDRRAYERELLLARRREHDIALRLQRSLLSGAHPEAPRLAVDVAYRPAERGAEIGGDWHDAFWLEEGRTVALVVGDVVGRGLAAAATMAQLRSAVRALAVTGLGPGALLDALDGYAERHAVGRMATAVVAELDLEAGRLRWACAGHLPPVLVLPGGEPELRWDGRSTPLDAGPPGAPPRDEAATDLPPGSTVVLCTDGLVERRDQSLDAALGTLTDAVHAHRHAPLPGLAGALLRELAPSGGHDDDVCVLAARLRG